MHLKYVRRTTAGLFVSVLFLASQFSNAQTSAPTASAVKATSAAKTPADFSLAIDPKSVANFSDEELNDTFNKMSTQYSKNAVLFNNIGATFFERKVYDKAEAAIKRATILNNHPAFLTNLSIVYDTQKRVPEAISAAQRAVSQSPRYERGRIQLCQLMVETQQNNDALICFDELAKFTTLDPMSQTLYALSYVRTKNYDRAIALVSPLTRAAQPTPLMFNVLGSAYYQKKRYAQAVETFKQGVELDPDSPNLRYNLAMSLTATNNRIGALSQYKLINEKNPQIAEQLYRYLYRDKIIYVDDLSASKHQ